tara:strand:- start:164 stop:928 length:765 start_codon:yes stop_codon:yes gene_type:complete
MYKRHLSYRSSNPALNSNTFKNVVKKDSLHLNETMTIRGTVDKTALALSLLLISGYYCYSLGEQSLTLILMFIGIFLGLILSFTTILKKSWAPFTVPFYSISQGFVLGGISFYYNSQYEGIVLQAILLTILVLISMLFAYRSKIIKPTENFKLGVFSALMAVFLLYITGFIMSFFGSGIPILNPNNSSLISIGFSVIIVILGAFCLVIDFDFIEEGAEKGVPKYMEWYGAFGLLVTLIWLYLEIIKLLAKLRNR